jgi:signal transduction histidine kinase
VQHLNSLLYDFRMYARPENIALEAVDLREVARELWTAPHSEYAERGISFQLESPPELPRVEADPHKIRQVLVNLLKNAVEAMPGGGTLTLRGYPGDGSVCFEVGDTGVGIPEELDVFDVFTTSKADGTGLGLAIVKKIVTAHGGSIGYASRPGEGTVFKVELPLGARAG